MAFDRQTSFISGKVSESLWGRSDIATYDSSCKELRNMFVHPEGGASNRSGTHYIADAKFYGRTRLIPFQFNNNDAYVVCFSDSRFFVLQDGAPIENLGVNGIQTTTLTASREADGSAGAVMYFPLHRAPSRSAVETSDIRVVRGGEIKFDEPAILPTSYAYLFVDTPEPRIFLGLTEADYPRVQAAEALYFGDTSLLFSPYAEADIFELKFTQSFDIMTFTHPDYPVHTLKRRDGLFFLEELVIDDALQEPIDLDGFQAFPTFVEGDPVVSRRYVVTAVDGDTGYESRTSNLLEIEVNLAALLDPTFEVSLTWETYPAGVKFNVYKEYRGLFGIIGSAGESNFSDQNIRPDVAIAPAKHPVLFQAKGDYPSNVTYYQQRIVYAGTRNSPVTMYFSRAGLFTDFSTSTPARTDDAIIIAIADVQALGIRSMRALRNLFLFTSDGIWILSANNASLSTGSLRLERQESWGCSRLDPLLVGSSFIYVSDNGQRVRVLNFNFQTNDYRGDELSVKARDLFNGRYIVDWAYERSPFGIIWCVMSDGKVLGLTYLQEQGIVAWHEHDTDGEFESVCCIPEGGQFSTYFVVKRTIAGNVVRFIERKTTRYFESQDDAYFLDAGRSYTVDPPATVFDRLDHLEGRTVTVVADGALAGTQTVVNGTITLRNPATKVHAGLSFTSDLQTVGVDFEANAGVSGSRKSISRVRLRLKNTAGLKAGSRLDRLEALKTPATQKSGGSVPVESGVVPFPISPSWDYDSSIFLRQESPFPFTVFGINADTTIRGRGG